MFVLYSEARDYDCQSGGTMPRISEERREERRAQIVGAALRCFIRNGYSRTTMADIIAASGLSAGAIYGYFDSKAQLVLAVAGEILADRRGELAAAGEDHVLSPAEIATILLEGVRRHAPVPVLVQVWAEATVDEELRGLVRTTLLGLRATIAEHLARWAQAHPERIPAESAEAWATASAPLLMSLVPGFVLQRAIMTEFDEDAFIRAISGVYPSAG
jgi:TetR/AcrR family transcriptional regulator, transcriptional repressor of aconitase